MAAVAPFNTDADIDAVRPVVRLARLFTTTPTPKRNHVDPFRDLVAEFWSAQTPDYFETLATSAGIDARDIRVNEQEGVRRGLDGDTPMIDLPEVKFRSNHGYEIGMRLCIAFCVDDSYSSKLWIRAGSPLDAPLPSDVAKTAVGEYRKLAVIALRWAWPRVNIALSQTKRGFVMDDAGTLEVSAIGVQDPDVGRVLGNLEDGALTAQELLADGKARRAISNAMLPLAESRLDARGVAECMWLSSPGSLVNRYGMIESRDLLYLVRKYRERVQALGVGFDDSSHGELAWRSALRVSRWIASRV